MEHQEEYKPVQKYKDAEDLFRPMFPEPGEFMELKCPNCDEVVNSGHLNMEKLIGKCNHCNNVFSFDDSRNFPLRNKPEIFQPEGIEVLRMRSELVIDYKWRNSNPVSGFMLFFTIIWNLFLIPFIAAIWASGTLFPLLFMAGHIGFGATMIYKFVSQFVNSTFITVDKYNLTIEHKPIKNPFNKDREIPVRQIDQVFVRKKVSHTENGVSKHHFVVEANLKNGETLELVKNLKSKEKAQYLEQEIEVFLDIKDRRVPGES